MAVLKNSATRRFKCVEATAGKHKLYLFAAPASDLYGMLAISRRSENKDEGYQRALSGGRVRAIKTFIRAGNTVPPAIIVSLNDGATFDATKGEIQIPSGSDVGWVIDGQHRLAGAHEAAQEGYDVVIPVVAFVGLSQDEQINQFITINREARGVPTSLYLDLLGALKNKKPQDIAKERASDIGIQLRRDENSSFYERIVVTRAPRQGDFLDELC
jgi:DGQHR domain-containing protein